MEAAAAGLGGGGDGDGVGGDGPGMAPGQHRCSGTIKTRRRRRWGGLRQQWKLLGLFEIDQQHEFYSLTCMMKEGLAAAVQNTAPTVRTRLRREHVTPTDAAEY